jgi:hypothetical protein
LRRREVRQLACEIHQPLRQIFAVGGSEGGSEGGSRNEGAL